MASPFFASQWGNGEEERGNGEKGKGESGVLGLGDICGAFLFDVVILNLFQDPRTIENGESGKREKKWK